ncbi:MAG: hypothetical protein L3J95_04775 [Thermoplasmata archaeon]|nr:hypothetical protein [Thermoplasmata archaeon]MCI4359720.1 hypothetical protein [Thermoplasmata archaeon]
MGGTTTSTSRRSADRSARGSLLGEPTVREIESHLKRREQRRDDLFEASRSLRREAQGIMGRIHEGRRVDDEIVTLARTARALAERVRGDGGGDRGLAHDALQESVEAILLDCVVRGSSFPSPKELGIGPEEYLGGLGDLVGEMRRLALTALSEGKLPGAREHLREMESVFRSLLRFEGPRAIVSLKPKQDAARAILEKTRGDVALAEVLARAGVRSRRTRGS